MERAIQLLANSEGAKSRRKEDRARGRILKKIGAGEAARRNEDGDEKAVREERRKEERISRSEAVKIGYF